MRHLFLFSALLLSGSYSVDARNLFKNGHTDYEIVLSRDASVSEKTACNELKYYLDSISSASFVIPKTPSPLKKKIYVGYDSSNPVFAGISPYALDDESFTYRVIRGNLLIYGGKKRGTMYGVYSFLENELGVRWYTSNYTKVPQINKYKLRRLNHTEHPGLKYRYTNFNLDRYNIPWGAHNKKNMDGWAREDQYGGMDGYWGIHTMASYVSAKEYYKKHKEYFALRDGKRVENGQLCLSNPDVLRICKEKLFKDIEEHPLIKIFSVSQGDNWLFCTCDKCKALEDKYGGHSGILIWFINQIADEVKVKYPGRYVSTFAFQYTQEPPTNIKPRDNVFIRITSEGCCFAHPISRGCKTSSENSRQFVEDIKAWNRLTDNLFVWDYVTPFRNKLIPYANFDVLAPNLRFFRDHNAIGVFEEANNASDEGCLDEIKHWVLMKLLWNPDLDTKELVKDFVYGYYGKSAPKIMEYIDLTQSLVNPLTHFRYSIWTNNRLYNDRFTERAISILEDAYRLADNDEIKFRVESVLAQPLYLKCDRQKELSYKDGTWERFITIAEKHNLQLGWSGPLKEYKQKYLNTVKSK